MDQLVSADGTRLAFKDWGSGLPVIFSHGWPLMSDAWEAQMYFMAAHGYRTVAYDRRGHGLSEQTWQGNDLNTYADDLATIIDTLGLDGVVLVGHALGGGEIARYITRHGDSRVRAAVLVGAHPPLMMKTPVNQSGLPREVFDLQRVSIRTDKSNFFRDLASSYYGANRPGSKVSRSVLDSFWLWSMQAGLVNVCESLRVFYEADQTEDLRKIRVPVLLIHGDDDQIVPITNSALKATSLLPRATLKVYAGAPHGLFATHANRLNEDLLAFVQAHAI